MVRGSFGGSGSAIRFLAFATIGDSGSSACGDAVVGGHGGAFKLLPPKMVIATYATYCCVRWDQRSPSQVKDVLCSRGLFCGGRVGTPVMSTTKLKISTLVSKK